MNIEIALSLISLLGMAFVSRHESRFAGFVVCAVGNILWVIWGLIIQHTEYLILFGGYLVFNSIGTHDEYVTWKRLRQFKKKYNS